MRARLVLVPIVFAAALLAGCTTAPPSVSPTSTSPDNGVSALSADEILAKSTWVLSAASSFRMKGAITATDGSKNSADLLYAGPNGQGTVTLNGAHFEVIKVGSDIYLKASDDFWKAQFPTDKQAMVPAFLHGLKGRYVKVSATNPAFSGYADMFDAKTVLKPSGTVSKGAIGTTNGIDTIAIIDSDDHQTMYIATHGQPYPVRIDGQTGDPGVDFTDFNAPADIKAPSADKVFDFASIMGG